VLTALRLIYSAKRGVGEMTLSIITLLITLNEQAAKIDFIKPKRSTSAKTHSRFVFHVLPLNQYTEQTRSLPNRKSPNWHVPARYPSGRSMMRRLHDSQETWRRRVRFSRGWPQRIRMSSPELRCQRRRRGKRDQREQQRAWRSVDWAMMSCRILIGPSTAVLMINMVFISLEKVHC
jgi:hypothetical protein